MLKKIAKNWLGESNIGRLKPYVQIMRLWRNVIYDARRYMKSSSAVTANPDRAQLQGIMTVDYHRLEKGLSLASPREGFGKDVVERLTTLLPEYERRFGYDGLCATVENVLHSYAVVQQSDTDARQIVSRFLAKRNPAPIPPDVTGTIGLEKGELFPIDSSVAQRFLESRRSLRQFTGQPLARETILQAAKLAQRAPSVCNRQSGRLFVTNEPAIIARTLAFQNGNRGFGDRCGAVFVVTSDMRTFTSVGERNQAYVDGGIFAMMLVQALHALNIGAVMLNWSMTRDDDRKMRAALGIPDYHSVITMVGCGYAPDNFRVAASPRLPLEEVVTWLAS